MLRLPVLHRAAAPGRRRAEAPGDGGGRANHDVVVSAVRTTARGEVGVLTSRGRVRPARRARPARAAGVRQRPEPPGRAAAQRGPLARDRRAGAGADLAAEPTAPASRSAPARASSSGSTPRCSARTSGRSSGSRTATRSSARSSWPPARRRCASSPPTPSCCTSAPTPSGRRAAPAAAWPASGSTAGERVAWFGALDPATAVVVTASGSGDRAARHRAGRGQGHAVQRVPRQGPRHRRRALPPVPQGRGHPGLRLGRGRAGPRRGASGAPVELPEADRPARRLRHPGSPADRGVRGPVATPVAGHRQCGRLCDMRHPLRRTLAVLLAVLAGPASLTACSGDDDEGRSRRADARGGAGGRQEDPRRDRGVQLEPHHRRPARRRHRHQPAPRASAPTPRRSTGAIKVVLSGQDVRGAGRRGRRQGLRPDPAHPGLLRRRPGRLRRPRPGRS